VPEFAEAAGLGLSTIVDFEKSRRDVSRAAVHAMQKALEQAGVQFIAKNGRDPGHGCRDDQRRGRLLSVTGYVEARIALLTSHGILLFWQSCGIGRRRKSSGHAYPRG
jgi:hypothetical protein